MRRLAHASRGYLAKHRVSAVWHRNASRPSGYVDVIPYRSGTYGGWNAEVSLENVQSLTNP